MNKKTWGINIQKELREFDNEFSVSQSTSSSFYKKNKAHYTLKDKNSKKNAYLR